MLDVGGRLQPYRPLLQSREKHYVAIDVRMTPLVDVLARGEVLPFADDSFDLVFCTQMLEYVEQPRQAIVEIHRVLKRGGTLLLSVPSIAPRDADEDAWRFLPAALRSMLAPYAQIEICAEGGTVTGSFRTLNWLLSSVVPLPWVGWAMCHTAVPVLNLLAASFELIAVSRNDQLVCNYSVRAQK